MSEIESPQTALTVWFGDFRWRISARIEQADWDNGYVTTQAGKRQPSVQAQLSVRNGRAAVEFYQAAFGAVELYRFGGTDDREEVVAQLAVGDSVFWVEDESPPHGTFSPRSVGGVTTRMLLVVDDPEAVVARALLAGGMEVSPVEEEHGWQLGRIDDPYGHRWEIGKPIGDWPPAGAHPSR
jgi:PhnB protein